MRGFFKTLIIAIALSSCNPSVEDLAGIYVKSPSENTVDSLFLYTDTILPYQIMGNAVFTYKQVLYDKTTLQPLLVNRGTWYTTGSRLNFNHFYFDLDEDPMDFSYSKESLENTVISFGTETAGKDIILDRFFRYERVGD
jgi:hypothetical protein